jgi:hypothetical protein
MNSASKDKNVPKIVFIIPYRNREQHFQFFHRQMAYVLKNTYPTTYRILFIHQCDNRTFNRGAMKNIGFIYLRNTYPRDYRSITMVFNDIDTMPFTPEFIDYTTKQGIVKHFYGFIFALGGIVSITGGDFEKVGGFPNFWAWGYEDNMLNKRVLNAGLTIDRSEFYPIRSENILHLGDSIYRTVNRSEFERFNTNTNEGYYSIHQLTYMEESIHNENIESSFINVSHFLTDTLDMPETNETHNLMTGKPPFKFKKRFGLDIYQDTKNSNIKKNNIIYNPLTTSTVRNNGKEINFYSKNFIKQR